MSVESQSKKLAYGHFLRCFEIMLKHHDARGKNSEPADNETLKDIVNRAKKIFAELEKLVSEINRRRPGITDAVISCVGHHLQKQIGSPTLKESELKFLEGVAKDDNLLQIVGAIQPFKTCKVRRCHCICAPVGTLTQDALKRLMEYCDDRCLYFDVSPRSWWHYGEAAILRISKHKDDGLKALEIDEANTTIRKKFILNDKQDEIVDIDF